MYRSAIIIIAFLLVSGFLSHFATAYLDAESKLGEFCNPLDGCRHSSLTCMKNICECASGYKKSMDDDGKCKKVGCKKDVDCNQVDPNRMCYKGSCSRCTDGLFLDSIVNRCITKLGNSCNRTKDCLPMDTSDRHGDHRSMPICRSGRCVCRSNYFPSDNWTACKPRNCGSQDECNPFGDDPYRYCSKSRRTCQCNMGYFEEATMSVCLPYIPIQYSLMMPFWLTMIMLTICVLVYISRRLSNGRAATREESSVAPSSDPIPHALNRPPPSYDTVVKEVTTEPHPPSYISTAPN